jgi:hypothetical protein
VITVRDEHALQIFYRPPGSPLGRAVDSTGRELKIPDRDWKLESAAGSGRRVLSFAFPDRPYAVLMMWEDGGFWGWYLNLQAPLARTPIGFDTVDHVLDVVIGPDGTSPEMKDQDELEEAVALGLFSPQDAAAFHRWADRAAEHVLRREPPFDRDWRGWEPDPIWPSPQLPSGWDSSPAVSPA